MVVNGETIKNADYRWKEPYSISGTSESLKLLSGDNTFLPTLNKHEDPTISNLI